ncbi:MAG: ABC transporter ATP-binding protein [Gammaproteobacteria bacterium]|nr:ABC transporter ATP-binding protein [Gammaproteobacteria bacterium]
MQLEAHNLHVTVGGIEVCRDLDLVVDRGDIVAILGANGAGKTTLLHTLAGLRKPDTGRVALLGRRLDDWTPRERAQRLGIVFQDHQDPLHASVMQTVLAGRHPFPGAVARRDRGRRRHRHRRAGADRHAGEAIAAGVGAFRGERKRVALASLLAQRPTVCLLDEPNTHLDLHHQISASDVVIRHVDEHGGSAVMVLHDVNLALRFCGRALLLFGDGETLHGAADEVLTSENLGRLYRHPMREFRDGQSRCFIPG